MEPVIGKRRRSEDEDQPSMTGWEWSNFTAERAAAAAATGAVGKAGGEVVCGEPTGVPGLMAVGCPARPDMAVGVAATGGALAPSKGHENVALCYSG